MPDQPTIARADVVIAGGAFAGLALALALRQGLGPAFKVTVADPAFAANAKPDPRASAIAAAARRMFETLGVWGAVATEAQPIADMVVTDSKLKDAVRPVFLTFAGEIEQRDEAGEVGFEPFAHMIENARLNAALAAKARDEGVELQATTIRRFHSDGRIVAEFADGSMTSAALLVAADGANSVIREQCGIATRGWSYGQSAIVTTVAHERDHNGRAEEHFLPAGPFAILPLKGRRSSLVWTETDAEAARVIALPDQDFHRELERRFGLHLGEIGVVGARRAFPLKLFIAREFIAQRIALVGDAAHVIHPIAGQGLNMGLRDVAALAEAVVDAARLGLDCGSADVLERYQRWRRFDTAAMGLATDGLNRLFSNESDVLRAVRDIGLGLVDRMPALKSFFIREAAGITGEVPKLLRGEAL
ncbi:MAG: ubiquinone biosynthesis hydroxylase [Alphaproteobacteria bacterium]|nr:ubiquinone biosynthesis hydroxylase [Alphaproteobacteria bacterium]